MKCCANCFASPTLQEHINEEGIIGDCYFCQIHNTKCIAVGDLYSFFATLFELYKEPEYGIDYYKGDDPTEFGETLPYLLEDEWYPIFSDDFNESKKSDFWEILFDSQRFDKDYSTIDQYTLHINRDGQFENPWEKFSCYLKERRRFTIQNEQLKNFIKFLPDVLSGMESEIEEGKHFFRARIGPEDESEPFPKEKMGTPPPEKTLIGGRANPPGIPFLYLADHLNTAISEIRPWKGAKISVATFITIKKLKLIDLTANFIIDDPFAYAGDLSFLIEDNAILRRLGEELSKPINPNKISIEYVPTQYVSEIIRNHGYDGMIYPSSLGETKNIVLFKEKSVKCEIVGLYEVDSVVYKSFKINP